MAHYDVDIHCRNCQEYMYSCMPDEDKEPNICDSCFMEVMKDKMSPLEYFIYRLKEGEG